MLDLVFLLLFLIALFVGWHRGMVAGAARIVSYLAALAIASRFAEPFGRVLSDVFGLTRVIKTMIGRQLPANLANAQVPPALVKPILEGAQVPQEYRDEILKNLANHTLLDAIAAPYVHLISQLLGLFVLTTLIYWVLRLVLLPVVRFLQIVVPKWLDHAGGLVLGFGVALLELAFLALFLPAVANLPNIDPGFRAMVEASQLLPSLTGLADALLHLLGFNGWLLPSAVNPPVL